MPRVSSAISVENYRDAQRDREREKKHHRGNRGACRQNIPVYLVQKKRAQKPTGSM